MDVIMGILPTVIEFAKPYVFVDSSHDKLKVLLQELGYRVEDMDEQARKEEANPGKKRKRVVEAYLKDTTEYISLAQSLLARSHGRQWRIKRMRYVPCIERYHREGRDLLNKGRSLVDQGLTCNEVVRRGVKLIVEEDQYMGETFRGHAASALTAMREGGFWCIGIYGYAGAGKTNLMKHLYNEIYDNQYFKAVFWAKAPDPDSNGNYNKAVQTCVAQGMWVDLGNGAARDEARDAGKIMATLERLGEIEGPGPIVYFLDNVKREFLAYELLGIPAKGNCILVFSTLSKDVCNRMKCDLNLKMELLGEKEAQELFLHEVGCSDTGNSRVLSNHDKEIHRIAVEVANQCARMPLAIIIIARSMTKIDNLPEWRNRVNELMGTIATIHGDENKIVEQLKFGYDCLKEEIVKQCFLAAATLLIDDRQASKAEIIDQWKMEMLIGVDRPAEYVDDQGHVILNQLERLCLLQVVPDDRQTVTMNKWICKMATSVLS
ncbi:probable disease resistance protein At1g12280 [Chenopodium quinoa]|uniref:NB-ARC domain-containing protein n=1 Tax=Chenopodium quinoa TaxID=63459 RepID=A0A803M9Q0_CHEQI|nr:probable disease resistance protein At1g12280 [Chenopodium quinoa]XP_021761883.1 probable disease resistance protein At1g12280 [Chenopodium quinoa]XP_021761884.1 probable disease resistance protein At1g12280 [Chenopodium quinoa]